MNRVGFVPAIAVTGLRVVTGPVLRRDLCQLVLCGMVPVIVGDDGRLDHSRSLVVGGITGTTYWRDGAERFRWVCRPRAGSTFEARVAAFGWAWERYP